MNATAPSERSGPLRDLRVVEIASIGPGPFAAMMLADQGADVVRIARPEDHSDGLTVSPRFNLMNRNRRDLALDLKSPGAVASVLDLISVADVLIEGFRPGTLERLGLGPHQCHARNPALIYGRMTGWGQTGPLAKIAGHDINYIAASGALHAVGERGRAPVPPLNLIGDLGGGAMLLVHGVLCALFERARSGQGQVVDAAMVEGSALMMMPFIGLRAAGEWTSLRGDNVLDGGAPFYGVYETQDGRYVAVGAVEERFFRSLLQGLGLDPGLAARRFDRDTWPELRAALESAFRQRPRDEWTRRFEGTDACVTAVLDIDEAPLEPHACERAAFVAVAGITQPAPAPRFDRSGASPPTPPGARVVTLDDVLSGWRTARESPGREA